MTDNSKAASRSSKRTWLYPTVVLLLVVAIVLAGHMLPGFANSDIHRQIRNSMHFIGFATVAAAIFEILPFRKMMSATVSLLFVIFLGGVSEVFQGVAGREFDVIDLLRDFSGALLYLIARISWQSADDAVRSGKVRVVRRLFSILVLMSIFVPLIYWTGVRALLISRHPVILDFAGRWDSQLYFPINSYIAGIDDEASRRGFDTPVLRVQLLRKNWSGLRIELVDSDWSDYEYLSFQVASGSDDEIRVNVELSDGEHPGMRSQHLIGGDEAGSDPIRIRVPLQDAVDVEGRPGLDTTNIMQIYIIARNSGAESAMLLADVRLE